LNSHHSTSPLSATDRMFAIGKYMTTLRWDLSAICFDPFNSGF
jgi:hypothetical protein